MKKFSWLLIPFLLLLFSCVPQNITIDADYVVIPFPQDELSKDFAGKVFYPGVHKFPSDFFTQIGSTGEVRKLIKFQIDDNIVIAYIEKDPRDAADHRLKFQDGTALAVDFKTTWKLKNKNTESDQPDIDIKTLLKVPYKLKAGTSDEYTTVAMYQEYAVDMASSAIRAEFKTIQNYSVFSTKYYTTIADIMKNKINSKLSPDCPIFIESMTIGNDIPDEVAKSAMILQSASDRDIEVIKQIGPYLKQYPEVVPYLQLKFAENNSSRIGNFVFGSTGVIPSK